MLEKETERLLKNVREQTIGKNETIRVKEILAAEIPYPLKVFLRADVERTLEEELRRGRTNSRFNYAHREIETLQRQMNSILVLDFSFPREEFLQKIDDGLHLVLNFLLRPQWTLTSFIFNMKPSISVSGIKKMLGYFGAYDYLKEILVRYVEEKRFESMAMNEFQDLLLRIDGEYIRRKDGVQLAQMTAPIYDFINFTAIPAAVPHTTAVQVAALVKFFEDKRLRSVCEAFEKATAQNGMDEVRMDQLGEILEQAHRSNEGGFVPDETFLKNQGEMKTPAGRPLSPESVEREKPVPAARERQAVLPDLNEFISEEDRRRIIRKIFKQDNSHYAASLKALNAMASWKDASTYIDKVLIANDIDPYSGEAVRFLELVQLRFTSRTARR